MLQFATLTFNTKLVYTVYNCEWTDALRNVQTNDYIRKRLGFSNEDASILCSQASDFPAKWSYARGASRARAVARVSTDSRVAAGRPVSVAQHWKTAARAAGGSAAAGAPHRSLYSTSRSPRQRDVETVRRDGVRWRLGGSAHLHVGHAENY